MPDKSTVTLASAPSPFLGCHAVRANGYCFCPVTVAPFGRETTGGRGDSLLAQFPRGAAAIESAQVLDLAQDSLKVLGSSLAFGTKIEQFTTHTAVAASYLEVRARYMETATRPASTNIQVSSLVNPN